MRICYQSEVFWSDEVLETIETILNSVSWDQWYIIHHLPLKNVIDMLENFKPVLPELWHCNCKAKDKDTFKNQKRIGFQVEERLLCKTIMIYCVHLSIQGFNIQRVETFYFAFRLYVLQLTFIGDQFRWFCLI